MAAGLPDLVDCSHLATVAAVLERSYELCEFGRLHELLAEPRGMVAARFAFATLTTGNPAAEVTVQATPLLVCQRCMQGFALPVSVRSEICFAARDEVAAGDMERELVEMDHGMVSLRGLAEEELLLALPIAPMCSTPMACGRAPSLTDAGAADAQEDLRRPFGALKDLLKKT